MGIYYKKKDKEGLLITVENKTSAFKFLSGNNTRLKLMYKDENIFYSTICNYWEGAWFIQSSYENFFPFIKSYDIEERKDLENMESLYSWSKFFIKKLEEIEFFYEGTWEMSFYIPHEKEKFFVPCDEGWVIHDFHKTFDFEKYRFLDFYGEDIGMILSTKPKEDEDSSRVKYWRKKLREDELPPILLMFIPSLDSFIILDGHCRYQASLLENKLPRLIVVSSVKKVIVEEDKKQIESVLKAIEKNQNRKDKNKRMSTQKINNLLINAYGNKDFFTSNFKAKAKYNFEKTWCEEITEELGESLELENILERRIDD